MAVARRSGRTVAAVALLLYPGAGLAVPLLLRWSVPGLVEANVMGTMLAGVVSIGWLTVQVEARDRRHLVEWTSNLRLLTSAEFEWLVGEVFRREGWKVRETGRQEGPDGNVDLELSCGGRRRVVQCKRWTAQLVGVNDVRQFAGTLMHEGLPGRAGIFVTLSDFTEQARAEAKRSGLELVDRRDLYGRVDRVRRTELCTVCGSPMILDRSVHGWWFHCVTAGCRGKRDLGTNAGRAVDLLTQRA